MQVIELEIGKPSEMIQHQDCDHLALGHLTGTLASLFAVFWKLFEIFELLIKFLAKFIRNTINFCNFVLG